jgi:hypothetical protein
MRTNAFDFENFDQPMSEDAGLERLMRSLEAWSDRQGVVRFPEALVLREPDCAFAEECFISAREAGATDDDLHDIPLAHFPQQWEYLVTEPVPAILE